MKRKENEDFDKYKDRRKADQIVTRWKLMGKIVWHSATMGQFVKGRDKLVNSREGKAEDAPKRPAGDQDNRPKPKPTKEHPDIEIYQQPLPLGEGE